MTNNDKFELIKKQEIPEIKSLAFLYRHIKTGAQILSLVNDDENKVFGITFRTPPNDSTGLPHILEHSVLCGSRKYPVKEPFVELMKSSLQTFLNAMTFPDKTCYPVASQNLQDFYNLIDVYLDAVFFPDLTPYKLMQEGWHYELSTPEGPLDIKGVVYSEMKGAYSSPDALLSDYTMRSLFPDNAYVYDSGGDPKKIPDLTFERFREFHKQYYHPSNALVYFYGDDDPEKRLTIIDEYLKQFDKNEIDSKIQNQKPFSSPVRLIRSYDPGDDNQDHKARFTINWLLPQGNDPANIFAMYLLEYILLGMPGSPLRKALIESGLGEDLAGVGLETDLVQPYFSTGLKGIAPENIDRAQNLIIQTLRGLAANGINRNDIEAAVNTIEFALRENNTGSYPRGLVLMLRALNSWLYDHDPLALVAFERPLNDVKSAIKDNPRYFEELIEKYLLDNPHRTTVILRPEKGLIEKEKDAQEKVLAEYLERLSDSESQKIIGDACTLIELQERADTPEGLASIPVLKLSDMEKVNRIFPCEESEESGTRIMFHDLFTHGIVYVDLGLNLHSLPQRFLPYSHLFGRALLEMGTSKEDYITLSQRISRKTGGIRPVFHTSCRKGVTESGAYMFLRGKAMQSNAGELLEIFRDILLDIRLDNLERFRQIVLEAKAREEQKMLSSGHQIASLRLKANFNEADWAAEQMSGISYLFFLRNLIQRIEEDWQGVLSDLEEIRRILVNRNHMILNITTNHAVWQEINPVTINFIKDFPAEDTPAQDWQCSNFPDGEAIIIPSQVNYVAKGTNICTYGYKPSGSVHVITRFLRTSRLWEEVRVKGGAYGVYCTFDRLSGMLTFLSYRDPNIIKTIRAFDDTAGFMKMLDINQAELEKTIIGTIGNMDSYLLPDAKGYISMIRHLSGETDQERQQIRDEILSTGKNDFRAFSEFLGIVRDKGIVKIAGSDTATTEVMKGKPGWLKIVRAL
ncbi:MAG: insulinase family protein [Deltaproteobacteria bacterium]|nr:insulinase family protein [Deltaproteobacteria bacterium]